MSVSSTVTLIGYRGSGKSTIAPIVAKRLGYDWIDADVEIEKQTNRTIQQIFNEGGEEEFRSLERELMKSLLQQSSLVIAAGGGAILNEATRADMKSAGPVVWLKASADELARRITTDPTTGQRRPSLTGQPVEDEVKAVLTIREPLYTDAATIVVETENMSTEQIADQVCSKIQDSSGQNQTDSGDNPCR